MAKKKKVLIAEFYRSSSGKEPVRDWIKSLPMDDRKRVGKDIAVIEYTWPVGMPLCRPLKGGVWEIRNNFGHGRIGRVLFFNRKNHMMLLHGFVKKTQKTPQRELQLAEQRMKEVLDHEP